MTGPKTRTHPFSTTPGAGFVPPAPLRPVAKRSGRTWAYPATDGRDARIDFLRGLAVLFVGVNAIETPSLYHLISHERIGAVSGADVLVALSGVVLGMVHRRKAIEEGWRSVATSIWSRALLLYATCIALIIAIYAISFLPFIDGTALTTWTDNRTGTTDPAYPSLPLLLDYPVPPHAVFDVLFLNIGPRQFDILGLYIVLLGLAPLAFHLLLRRRWWIVLGLSWTLYLANSFLDVRIVPAPFEDLFPVLSWQVLFVTGLVAGFYRKPIIAWFDRPAGRMSIIVSVMLCVAFLVFSWNNPVLGQDPFALRLSIIPPDTFGTIYGSWFGSDSLGILRIANVAVLIVVAYAVLSRCWVPLNRTLGWLLVPLGRATLYVLTLHLAFASIADSLLILQGATVWLATTVETVIIMTLWMMVRCRVLSRWIPR